MNDLASKVRSDFPILSLKIKDKPLVYLDNAATTQKPKSVIDALDHYYKAQNGNVHRGVHYLSQLATEKYESARDRIQKLINAPSRQEVIFTRGTTEAINLVAQSYARPNLKPGDEVLITEMEHHSNIVPWQIVCDQTGAKLKVVKINELGEIETESFKSLLTEKTKIFAVTHVSNSLGTINPIKDMVAHAKKMGAVSVVDGAQAIQHLKVDVQDLGADFYAFSGHKIYGPTGIGILYGRKSILEKMIPYQGGGDMIRSVTFEKTTYNDLPYRFEAGTPHIEGAIGLGAAIDYVNGLGLSNIEKQESALLEVATLKLRELPELTFIGQAKQKCSVLSFTIKDIHPHDAGTILDQEGIAIRAGHHCTQPVMDRFKVPATVRASFAFYNSMEDIDRLVVGLKKTLEIFK